MTRPYATVKVNLNEMVWTISTAGRRTTYEREGEGEVAATCDDTVWIGVDAWAEG